MLHRIRNVSTQTKVTLLIAAAILLFFLVTLQCLSLIKAQWEQQVLITAQKNIELISGEWTQLASNIQAEASRLANDENVTTYLRTPKGVLSNELLSASVSSRLFDSAMNLDYAKSLCIIKSHDEYVFRNLYRYYFSDAFIKQLLKSSISEGFQICQNLNGQPFLLYAELLPVPVAAGQTGYLLLYLDLTVLETLFAPLNEEYSGYALVGADSGILYHRRMDNIDTGLQVLNTQRDIFQTEDSDHVVWMDNGVLIAHRFQQGKWIILQNINRSRLFAEINRTIILLIILFAALCFLLFFSLQHVFALYYRRVERLRATMAAVKGGALNIRHPDDGTDELAQIGRHFNDMLRQIQDLVVNISLKESSLREAQLNALRRQINPHFLYNTLETIRMLAVMHDDPEIKEITQDLSDILRYSLDESDRDSCLVGAELLMLQRYVRIQQARFPGRFTYSFEIDESVCSMRMYKFLLQPLVENAFKHGINATLKVSRLLVQGAFKNGLLTFTVFNTGAPMAPDTLSMLNDYSRSGNPAAQSSMSGIGLRNVIDRIRLYFGENGRVLIESDEKSGTSVTIQFPPL